MEEEKIKLMYLVPSFAIYGGVERVITDKMNYLVEHGFNVTLVTYEAGKHSLAYPLDHRIRHIDTDTRFFTLYRYNRVLRSLKHLRLMKQFKKRLQETTDEIQPDFIITTTLFLPVVKIVYQLKSSACLVLESHIPMSYTLKGDTYEEASTFKRFFMDIYAMNTFRHARHFDLLVSLTKGDAAEWRSLTNKIDVIPNPVTYYPESIPKEHSANRKRIISVGRLAPQKGFDMLVESFSLVAKECPDWTLDIYGDGDEYERLATQIEQKQMQGRIHLHSATNDIYSEYLKSDFYVMSSRYEGFPLVLGEAMSCELPCVSFDCSYGPRDIITDGVNGLLANNGDVEDLANKIKWMCHHDAERQKMGQNARISASQYRKENIMARWVDLFRQQSAYS